MSTQSSPNNAASASEDKQVSMTVNGRMYDIEECRTIASALLTKFAADFGLIEWSIDDDGEMVFYQPMCCDHDCSAHDES